MILTCAHPAPAERRERRENSIFHGYRTDYIVPSGPEGTLTPQAFLVEQDPHYHLSSHYHLQHQFQVMVGGGGTLGKHEIQPFTTHYASPESGYGPIVAGDAGLSYFTLRVVADMTTWVLPEHRARMRRGLRKRQRFADAPADATAAPRGSGVDAAIPLDEHGNAAWFVRLAAGESLVLPDAQAGAGRFHIVASGAMRVGEQLHGPLGVVFTSNDESTFAVEAGPDGLQVMVVQFPRDALP